jgi:hypothetical protein
LVAAGALLACGRTDLDRPVVVSAGHDAQADAAAIDLAVDQQPEAAPDGPGPDGPIDHITQPDVPADLGGDGSADRGGDRPTDVGGERPTDAPPETGLDVGNPSIPCGGPCPSGTRCVRGSYTVGQILPTGRMPNGLVSGDFDSDGVQDLVVANKDSPFQQIFFGSRSGTFSSGRRLDTANPALAVATADFDADGRLDLAFSFNFNLTIWKGDGAGGFRLTQNDVVGVFPVAIAAADMNRDGAVDLTVPDYNQGEVLLLSGDGQGVFRRRGGIVTGSSPIFVAAADLDADTNMDLVVVEYGADTISVHFGNTDGTFAAGRVHEVPDAPDRAALADFDRDGDLDVAVSSGGASTVSLFWNDGSGGLGSPSSVATGTGVGAVTAADIDTDGVPDLVVRNVDSVIGTGHGSVSVLLGNADRAFRQVHNIRTGSLPESIVAVDVTGDTHPELAVVDYIDYTLTILIWNEGYSCR